MVRAVNVSYSFSIDVAPPRPNYPFTPKLREAFEVAAEWAGVSVQGIAGESRRRELVVARWALMLALDGLGWSYGRIGKVLGGRDHTTVMYGLTAARKLVQTNADFRKLRDAVKAAI